MTAAGHGQYQPVDSNANAVGRAENRRTDIDLVPTYTQ
jgi:chemotaxis protein MotB